MWEIRRMGDQVFCSYNGKSFKINLAEDLQSQIKLFLYRIFGPMYRIDGRKVTLEDFTKEFERAFRPHHLVEIVTNHSLQIISINLFDSHVPVRHLHTINLQANVSPHTWKLLSLDTLDQNLENWYRSLKSELPIEDFLFRLNCLIKQALIEAGGGRFIRSIRADSGSIKQTLFEENTTIFISQHDYPKLFKLIDQVLIDLQKHPVSTQIWNGHTIKFTWVEQAMLIKDLLETDAHLIEIRRKIHQYLPDFDLGPI